MNNMAQWVDCLNKKLNLQLLKVNCVKITSQRFFQSSLAVSATNRSTEVDCPAQQVLELTWGRLELETSSPPPFCF